MVGYCSARWRSQSTERSRLTNPGFTYNARGLKTSGDPEGWYAAA